jgi:MFS family permease
VEALLPQTITDIFFLHDRGEKIAIYGLSLLGGYEIGPVLSAYIIQYLGMDWYVLSPGFLSAADLFVKRAFYVIAIALAATFVVIALFMPETAYYGTRPVISVALGNADEKRASPEIDSNTVERVHTIPKAEHGGAGTKDSPYVSESGSVDIPPKSYIESLSFWSVDAKNPHLTVRQAFLRPLILCA